MAIELITALAEIATGIATGVAGDAAYAGGTRVAPELARKLKALTPDENEHLEKAVDSRDFNLCLPALVPLAALA